jgi:hypothetical protein
MADSKARESERKKEEAMRLAEMMSGAVKQVKPKLGLVRFFCFFFFFFFFVFLFVCSSSILQLKRYLAFSSGQLQTTHRSKPAQRRDGERSQIASLLQTRLGV